MLIRNASLSATKYKVCVQRFRRKSNCWDYYLLGKRFRFLKQRRKDVRCCVASSYNLDTRVFDLSPVTLSVYEDSQSARSQNIYHLSSSGLLRVTAT